MSHGHPTTHIACTRALKKVLIAGLAEDLQPILRDVFARADRLAFTPAVDRPAAILAFDAYCETLPCLPWFSDERTRHVEVQIYRHGPAVVSVARAVWAVVHVVSQQGPDLGADDELLHRCCTNGDTNTGQGACLNPAHLFRGDAMTRVQVMHARNLLRGLGATA